MQLVPTAPAPAQLRFQASLPQFAGPLMERVVYELHHNPTTSNDPNQNTQLNGKVNQLISDLHHHAERHTLPYWPNNHISPTRIAPFWSNEQNQRVARPTSADDAAPAPSFYPVYTWPSYYNAEKLANSNMKTGSKLQFIA